ncbi:MAG: hypothetical protein HY291_05355 [Planctomycetes bacterium]|nr:hypothetical protein [Planctomycetota bacterium]
MKRRIRLAEFVKKNDLGLVFRNRWWTWPKKPPYTCKQLDLGFIRKSRLSKSWLIESRKNHGVCPDLAVITTNSYQNSMHEAIDLVEAGVKIVWVVWPYDPTVYEFKKGKPIRRYWPHDRIRPPAFLPGFNPIVCEWIKRWPTPRKTAVPTRTLFSQSYYYSWKRYNPTLASLRAITDEKDSTFHEDEIGIFQDLFENEYPYLPKTAAHSKVWGALTLRFQDGMKKEADHISKGLNIPDHGDAFEVVRCKAQGILLVEKNTPANIFAACGAAKILDMLIIGSCGIPRAHTRRFLRHLQDQFRLPVYLLTDNDTWGYFIFSVLKRGLTAPYAKCRELALKDIRFLGLRTGDLELTGNAAHYRIGWEKHWALRLRAMSHYPCFAKKDWKKELQAFEAQRGKLELEGMADSYRRQFVSDNASMKSGYIAFMEQYLKPKIESGDWLT